jgi:IS5 family transposase
MPTDSKAADYEVAPTSNLLRETIEALTALGNYLMVVRHRWESGCAAERVIDEAMAKSMSQYERACEAVRGLRRLLSENPPAPAAASKQFAEGADRLIWQNNIGRITDKACREVDIKSQQVSRHLLIIEENRFGTHSWQLETVEQHIADCARQIEQQNERIIKMETVGYDTTASQSYLQNLIWARDSFIQFRDRILIARQRPGKSASPPGKVHKQCI